MVRASLRRAGAGPPAGRDPRGGRRWGAPGRAACGSSCIPPQATLSPPGERGQPPGPRGGGGPASPRLAGWGGMGGEGGEGGPRRHSSPPCPVGRPVAPAPATLCLRRTPLGYTRAVGVAGRPWASGTARSAASGSVWRGGVEISSPWPAFPPSPGRPLSGPLRVRLPGCRRSVVGRQRVMRVRTGSPPGALGARLRLSRLRCPPPGVATPPGGCGGRCPSGRLPSALGLGGGGGVPWLPDAALRRPRGGGLVVPALGGQPSTGGAHFSPVPLHPLRAGPSCRPSLAPAGLGGGGEGRWALGAAVWVSGLWLVGYGAVGPLSHSLSPPSFPREVARAPPSRGTVGGRGSGGPAPPGRAPRGTAPLPLSRARRLGRRGVAVTPVAACVGVGVVAVAGSAGGSASGRRRCAKTGGASCWRPHP